MVTQAHLLSHTFKQLYPQEASGQTHTHVIPAVSHKPVHVTQILAETVTHKHTVIVLYQRTITRQHTKITLSHPQPLT